MTLQAAMEDRPIARRFDTTWGAVMEGPQARFRLWAPGVDALSLRLEGDDLPMSAIGEGWWEVRHPAEPGARYAFVLPDGRVVPDPVARAQADGVNGPSVLVDPSTYAWTVRSPMRRWEEAVIYELHVGTFTPEGTFAAAADRMGDLAALGVTAVELMPLGQFPGGRGWGYDGVLPYAPHAAYGTPTDLKRLVEAAHAAGLMVLLDVVYNHFGPEGNHLAAYAPGFYASGRQTPWGAAFDYAEKPVRTFFIENALYWLEEYDLDGFRFDAIDQIQDPSDPDLLLEIARRVRRLREGRPTWLTTEDNRNVTGLHERGGEPLYDGEWNDDLHNAVHVIATGETDGYYGDFADDPWRLCARALAEGFSFQGEASGSGEPRGEPSAHLPPTVFVDFLQNHDQVGNRAMGERLSALVPPPLLEALTAMHLLSPHVPLLFMGEEVGETHPFFFFTDFEGDLADAVREGRRREFAAFERFADPKARMAIPDPNALDTFERSKLSWSDDAEARAARERTRDLLTLRRERLVPRLAGAGGGSGRVVEVSPGAVSIDWRLDGALWRLRANLSDAPRAMPVASGERVFGPAPGAGWELPAHAVAVFEDPLLEEV